MIETQTFSKQYTADGEQTQWAVDFPYLSASDIHLFIISNDIKTEIDKAYFYFDTTTDIITYPLSGDPVPAGDKVYLERQTPITQEEDSSIQNFKSNDVERMADKLTMISQEVKRNAESALHITDDSLSNVSENPVQNKIITTQINLINTNKQDVISDLSTIRSGASAGATALQQTDVTSTYSATGTAPVNGTAVASAISEGLANKDLSNLTATGEAHFDSTYVKLQNGVTQANVDYVVSTQLPTAENNYRWNRVYKSGWVEQGGIVDRSQTDTVNLSVPMADNYYSIFMFSRSGHVYAYQNTASTTTYFKFNSADDETDNNTGVFYWEVKGLKASE